MRNRLGLTAALLASALSGCSGESILRVTP